MSDGSLKPKGIHNPVQNCCNGSNLILIVSSFRVEKVKPVDLENDNSQILGCQSEDFAGQEKCHVISGTVKYVLQSKM